MTYYKKYECTVCGHIYDEEQGDSEADIASGTLWADVPDDWRCPQCNVSKDYFELLED